MTTVSLRAAQRLSYERKCPVCERLNSVVVQAGTLGRTEQTCQHFQKLAKEGDVWCFRFAAEPQPNF